MGGEGHMLDMIKRLELNRQQRENARNKSKNSRKPPILTDSLQNIESFDISQKEELTPQQKKKYQFIAILALIILVIAFATLLIFIF